MMEATSPGGALESARLTEAPWILTTHESSAQGLSVPFCTSSFSSELLWQNFLQVYHPPEIINRQSLKPCAWSQDFLHPPLNISQSDPFLKSPRHLFWWWAAAAAKSLQSCPTLRDRMDCSPLGSSVHGIFQARILELGAIAFSETYTILYVNYISIKLEKERTNLIDFHYTKTFSDFWYI